MGGGWQSGSPTTEGVRAMAGGRGGGAGSGGVGSLVGVV